MEVKENNNMVDKDNLVGVVRSIDAINYLLQDLTEDYFEKFDSSKKEDIYNIAWEYNRHRAKTNAIQELIWGIEKTFEKYNITCYSN